MGCTTRIGFILALALWGLSAVAQEAPESGTILLIGDSLFDGHRGEARVEGALKRQIAKSRPQRMTTIPAI